MNSERVKYLLNLVFNTIIFISACIISFHGVFYGAGQGQVGSDIIHIGYLKPYTMDSNILAGLSSLAVLTCSLKGSIPKWAAAFQLMSTVCLCVTFFVAVSFLAPVNVLAGRSYFVTFSGDMFFFHLVNPVLAVISFTCLQKKCSFRKGDCLIGALPTVIYSFVYLTMVVFLKKWEDFYGFTFGGRYYLIPLVFLVIYTLAFGFSLILISRHNKGLVSP